MTDEKTDRTIINMGSWTTKTVIYVVLAALLIGAAGGGYAIHRFQTCPAPKGQTSMTLGKDSTVQMKTSYDFKVDVTEMVKAQVNDKLAIQNAELRRTQDEELRRMKAKNKAENFGWGLGGFAVGFAVGRLSK